MAAPGEADIPTKRKTFIPLGTPSRAVPLCLSPPLCSPNPIPENNPEVMSHLVHHLGVSPTLGFYDIYSIDDPDLLAFIPRPAYALIFICPADYYFKARKDENEKMPEYHGSGPEEPVIWFKQTIRHACGLIALLHAVSNGGAKAYIQPDSDLQKLLKEATPLKPGPRADVLYDSKALEAAHQSAAQKGDTAPPPGDEKNGFHFICFVKADDGHLWELNGGMKGPVDRGLLEPDEDALSEKALRLGVRTFMAAQSGDEDPRFSLVALAPSFD